jgi:hypothetical protein
METKPTVKLIGKDGNAYAVLGSCQEAAKKAKWPKEKIDEFMKEATKGDYNNLLATAMEWFNVK